MEIAFCKYEATGNDFVIIDDRSQLFDKANREFIRGLCHRRFGIGADGLILLQNSDRWNFRMIYFNADGREASFCGNGARCIVHFANALGITGKSVVFEASDGIHKADLIDPCVKLQMCDVSRIEIEKDHCYLNTGSPHYVKQVKNVGDWDVQALGKEIRYSQRFKEEGTNVNFFEWCRDHIFMRTYERGVEAETYSCGTGVVATALAASSMNLLNGAGKCRVKTRGGELWVYFEQAGRTSFSSIWLEGPVRLVFEGKIIL